MLAVAFVWVHVKNLHGGVRMPMYGKVALGLPLKFQVPKTASMLKPVIETVICVGAVSVPAAPPVTKSATLLASKPGTAGRAPPGGLGSP
jgi:hypothetical protein